MKIKAVQAKEILDSRGQPTLWVEVLLENKKRGWFGVPAGASRGKNEALELRDNDPQYFNGLGVKKACQNINEIISPKLKGLKINDQTQIDKILLELDGTPNKSNLGANALIGVSGACLRAAAFNEGLFLWQYISEKFNFKPNLPGFLMNLVNGGAHAHSELKFQEYLLVLDSQDPIQEKLNLAYQIFQKLKEKIKERGYRGIGLGDEGGLVISTKDEKLPLKILNESIQEITPPEISEEKTHLGLDLASSNFYQEGSYFISEKKLSQTEMIDYLITLAQEFNLVYLEDPLFEDDFEGFSRLKTEISPKCLVIGDDLTVTNSERIQEAIQKEAVSGVIIKPNQIGTITETIQAIKIVQGAGLKVITSHRSGETNDDFLADLAVGVGADLVKAGGLSRGERLAKYNRFLEIEKEIKN